MGTPLTSVASEIVVPVSSGSVFRNFFNQPDCIPNPKSFELVADRILLTPCQSPQYHLLNQHCMLPDERRVRHASASELKELKTDAVMESATCTNIVISEKRPQLCCMISARNFLFSPGVSVLEGNEFSTLLFASIFNDSISSKKY